MEPLGKSGSHTGSDVTDTNRSGHGSSGSLVNEQSSSKSVSLQESFLQYKKRRQVRLCVCSVSGGAKNGTTFSEA